MSNKKFCRAMLRLRLLIDKVLRTEIKLLYINYRKCSEQ